MLDADFLKELSENLNVHIRLHKPLSGGDINAVYLLDSEKGKWVLKVNDAQRFPGMFEKEARGLRALREPQVIDVPEVVKVGEFNNSSYLILEHKASGKRKPISGKISGGNWQNCINRAHHSLASPKTII